jgi:hypothetical protein
MTLVVATAASLCLVVAGATHRSPTHRRASHARHAHAQTAEIETQVAVSDRAFRQVLTATVEGAYVPARPAAATAPRQPTEAAAPAPVLVAPAPAPAEGVTTQKGQAPGEGAALAPALEQATRIEASAYAWNDSNALSRLTESVSAATSVSRYVRLRAAGGASHLFTPAGTRSYGVGGGALTIGTGLISLNAQGALVQQPYSVTMDAQLGATLGFSLGSVVLKARSRPFIEGGDVLATDESVVYSAGLGSAVDVTAVSALRVSEVSLSGGVSPFRWLMTYFNALAGWVSDGNRTLSASAGARVSTCKALGLSCPLDLTFRWDGYLLNNRVQQPGYFSPALFDSQSLGAELRFAAAGVLELWAAGGAVLGLLRHDPPGYFVGGGFTFNFGPLSLASRFTVQNEQYYQSKRGWVGLGFQF